jgi:sec-independent protein translocase protein TatA
LREREYFESSGSVANHLIAQHDLLAFFDGLGGPEVLLVLVVILIFFGGEKMPEFARGLGKAMREFKKAASEVEQEFKKAIDEPPEKPVRPAVKAIPAPGAQPAQEPAGPPVNVHDHPSPHGDPPGDHGIDA